MEKLRKAKIYTRKGDKGLTSNFSGTKISKDCQSIKVIGAIDELNARMGVMEIWNVSGLEDSILDKIKTCQDQVHNIQTHLFEFGASISSPKYIFKKSYVDLLETWIDQMDSELEKLRNFIYPRSHIQVARATCRSAERELVELNKSHVGYDNLIQNYIEENTNLNLTDGIIHTGSLESQLKYLNRLSDYIFTLDRYYTHLTKEKVELKFNQK